MHTVEQLKEMEKAGTLKGMFTQEQIPDEIYHAPGSPGISRSGLNLIAEYPAKYKYYYIDGNDPKEKDCYDFGKMFHKAILEYDNFYDNFASDQFAFELGSRNSNKYKDAIAEFQEANPGKQIVKHKDLHSHEDFVTLEGMVKSIKEHPIASQIFKGGVAEAVLYWNDPATGVLCKCKVDYIRNDLVLPPHYFAKGKRTTKFFIELKSTRHIMKFEKEIGELKYFCQGPWYQWGGVNALKDEYALLFVAVEKEPTYAIRIGMIDPDDHNFGSICMNYALPTYAECLHTNKWPALNMGIETFKMPEYIYSRHESDKKETEVPNGE